MFEGIFSMVSSCTGVFLPMESCLITNFLQNLSTKQRIIFDSIHCNFTTFTDGEIKLILNDARKSCNDVNLSMKETTQLDFVTSQIEAVFRSDICLKAACKAVNDLSKNIENVLENESIAIKSKMLEVMSDCNGDKLSMDDCVVSTALDLLFQRTTILNTEIVETSESDDSPGKSLPAMEPHNYNLSSNGNDLSRSLEEFQRSDSFNSSAICRVLPTMEEYHTILSKIVQDAELLCKQNGNDISGSEEMVAAIKALFQDSSCLSTFCKGLGVDIADDHLNSSNITKSYTNTGRFRNELELEYFFKCVSIETNTDSCITNSFLDELTNFLELQAVKRKRGRHDTRPILQNKRRKLQSSTKTPSAYPSISPSAQPSFVCPITKPKIFEKHELIQRARQGCTNEPIQELIIAHRDIQKILHANYCWDQICSEDSFSSIVDQFLENHINASAADTKEISIDFMIQCANIEIDNNSCIRSSLLNEVKYYEGQTRRLIMNRRLQSTKSPGAFRQSKNGAYKHHESFKAPGVSTETPTTTSILSYPSPSPYNPKTAFHDYVENSSKESNEECLITKPDEMTLMYLLNNSIDKCTLDGIISSEQLLEAEGLLTKLTQAGDCWELMCSDDAFLGRALDQCFGFKIPLHKNVSSDEDEIKFETDRATCMRKKSLTDLMNANLTIQNLCFPPFYKEIKSICYTKLGPAAYDFCSERHAFVSIDDREESISDLCFQLEKISGDKGQQCLKPYCLLTVKEDVTIKKSLVMPSIARTSFEKLIPGSLEIVFDASVSLSSFSFDVQKNEIEFNSMIKILEDAFVESLPRETKSIRILSTGNTSPENLSHHRLEKAVAVDFQFIIESECEKPHCEDSSGIVIQSNRQRLEVAVSSGELADSLRLKSKEMGLKFFDDIKVQSLAIKNVTIKVNISNTDKIEVDDTTSAGSKMLTPLFALYGIYILVV
jgi:hypothetical protein